MTSSVEFTKSLRRYAHGKETAASVLDYLIRAAAETETDVQGLIQLLPPELLSGLHSLVGNRPRALAEVRLGIGVGHIVDEAAYASSESQLETIYFHGLDRLAASLGVA